MLSGLVGLIDLFGIAWLADTWISANEAAIVSAVGELLEQARWMIAIFVVAALTTSQAAAPAAIVPIGLTLGVPPQFLAAFSTACIGIYFFPANGSQVASITLPRGPARRLAPDRLAYWNSVAIRFTRSRKARRGGHLRGRRARAEGLRAGWCDRGGGHPLQTTRGPGREPQRVHLTATVGSLLVKQGQLRLRSLTSGRVAQ